MQHRGQDLFGEGEPGRAAAPGVAVRGQSPCEVVQSLLGHPGQGRVGQQGRVPLRNRRLRSPGFGDDTESAGQADKSPAASSPGSSDGAQGSGDKAKGGSEAGVERCRTDKLEAAFATGEDAQPAREDGADGATTATIVLMNKGTSSCKLGGFPGVDLTSINGGERWSLARSSQKWSSVEVEAGQSTEFTLNLAFTKEEEGFYQPAWVEITPPNETKSLKIEWPWETDSLVDQRGATHPGTFVNPIG